MRKWLFHIILAAALILCFAHADSAEARGRSAVDLNLMPTANTLGSGGYSFSSGMLPYDTQGSTLDPVSVDIGGFFKERHKVKLKSDIWLVPTRITFGLSERFDLTFGGTYSAGDTDKSILDYFETGDDKERVYEQTVVGGVLGMKYGLQEATERLPAVAVGGEVQLGYTVDNNLVDDTPADDFPFVAVQLYLSASYDFEMASLHGSLGMFLSSEAVESDERFDIPIQVGAEIPFDGFAAVVDIALFRAFSGVGLDNIISGGLRYDISSRAMLNASIVSVCGFIVRLTVGGKQSATVAPSSAPTLF